MLGIFKLNLGIDFSSGTRVEILADQPLTRDEYQITSRKSGIHQVILSFQATQVI